MARTVVFFLFMIATLTLAPVMAGAETAAKSAATTDTKAPASKAGEDTQKQYDVKIKQLEENITQLKEKIFRSKSRLLVLQETILKGVIAGAKAVVYHEDQLGGLYYLESVAYYLDGNPIYGRTNENGELKPGEEMQVYDGNVNPGNHMLTVYMIYRGQSSVFSYIEGIRVKLKANYVFKAEEGKVTRVDVKGFDKGGVTAQFEKRPGVKFDSNYLDFTEIGTTAN